MKFFIDTANLEQIKEAQDLGILDGVTTNPSLMAKEGISGKEAILNHYKTICEIADGDISVDGMNLIEEIRIIFDNYMFETEILAASIRSPMHIINCAKIGADVITSPLDSILNLLNHPLTDKGLAQFVADAKKLG